MGVPTAAVAEPREIDEVIAARRGATFDHAALDQGQVRASCPCKQFELRTVQVQGPRQRLVGVDGVLNESVVDVLVDRFRGAFHNHESRTGRSGMTAHRAREYGARETGTVIRDIQITAGAAPVSAHDRDARIRFHDTTFFEQRRGAGAARRKALRCDGP